MVLNILSGDIQIADRMVMLPTQDELAAMAPTKRGKWETLIELFDKTIASQGVERGQKAKINKEQFKQFAIDTAGLTGETTPGGSSANTLTTLSKLLNVHPENPRIAVDMLGVVGEDINSHRIRGSLDEAGINLLPKEYKPGQIPEAAMSFVFKEPGPEGRRTIVTYPGNARDILTPDLITPELVQKSDVVFVQGSLWEKLNEDVPNELLKLRYGQINKDAPPSDAKEIWLALPTHAQFRDNMPPKRYRYLIPSADVVMGNDEELMRIYETKNFDEAINKLQADISERDAILEKDRKLPHSKQPVAFITCGKEGAVVITPDHISKIAASDKSKIKTLHTLGAGDNSYSGFLAGHIAGLEPEKSAELGMQVAGAKLAFDGPRMPNPREGVREFSDKGRALLQLVDTKLGKVEQLKPPPRNYTGKEEVRPPAVAGAAV